MKPFALTASLLQVVRRVGNQKSGGNIVKASSPIGAISPLNTAALLPPNPVDMRLGSQLF